MIKIENHLGTICISQEYFTNLVGHTTTGCFGVSGMAVSNTPQKLTSKFSKRENPNKGVRVRSVGDRLYIDIHIIVIFGMNISAIVKSIVNKVKYAVEEATGFEVAKVNVYVDSMKTE